MPLNILSWPLNCSKSIPNTIPKLQNQFFEPWMTQNRFRIPSNASKLLWMAWNRLQIPSRDIEIPFMVLPFLKIDSKYYPEASNLLSWHLIGPKLIPNTIPRLQISFYGPWTAQNRFQIASRAIRYPFMAFELLKIDSKPGGALKVNDIPDVRLLRVGFS